MADHRTKGPLMVINVTKIKTAERKIMVRKLKGGSK